MKFLKFIALPSVTYSFISGFLYIGNELSENKKVIAKRLVRHPFGIVKIQGEGFVLTENGRDIAEGFIDSLLHLRRIKNVK